MASPDALARFAADEALFGPLAHDTAFATLLAETVATLDEWAKVPQPVNE